MDPGIISRTEKTTSADVSRGRLLMHGRCKEKG